MPGYRWAILTGEYPPQNGGVSDYTHQFALALAAVGDEVHIWAPACAGAEMQDAGIHVHRLPDCFGLESLFALSRELGHIRPTRVLVQYVPDAFGMRAMNIPFCLWLLLFAPQPVWTMFHEVAYPWVTGSLKLNVLAAVTRGMACILLAASKRTFVSIPAWEQLLRPFNLFGRPITWSPVPSNLPASVDRAEVAAIRNHMGNRGSVIIGHFSSFTGSVPPLLRKILPPLLKMDSRRIGLLLGRGGQVFRESLLTEYPELSQRLHATGALAAPEVARHLAACDLLLQPYPDGASCRRSSLMAGVALGAAMVTTTGRLTEPLWQQSGAVALADAANPGDMVRLADELLADEQKRAALGARAKTVYAEYFSVEHTVARLRN